VHGPSPIAAGSSTTKRSFVENRQRLGDEIHYLWEVGLQHAVSEQWLPHFLQASVQQVPHVLFGQQSALAACIIALAPNVRAINKPSMLKCLRIIVELLLKGTIENSCGTVSWLQPLRIATVAGSVGSATATEMKV
jgi:hypothetical protein